MGVIGKLQRGELPERALAHRERHTAVRDSGPVVLTWGKTREGDDVVNGLCVHDSTVPHGRLLRLFLPALREELCCLRITYEP